MFPLRQSPDDSPVATAEPEATAGAAPEGDQPEPVVAAPAAVQEPSTEESGASGPEDEAKPGEAKPEEAAPDPRSQLTETLKALRQEHPDLYDSVYSPEERERLAGGQEERGEEVALERSQLVRQQAMVGAEQTYQDSTKSIEEAGKAALSTLKATLAKQSKAVQDGQATEITPDFDDISGVLKANREETLRASFGYFSAAFDNAVQDMLETHTSRRYLSPDDLKRIDDAQPQEKLRVRIHAQLDAAIKRGSTAEVKLAAKKEAEETVGLTKHLEKIQALIPTNGATNVLETGGGQSHSFATMADADDAYNNDEISHDEYKRQRERFKIPDVAR